MSLTTRWILVFLWLALPFVFLGAAGAYLVWERGWGIPFTAVGAVVSIVGWVLFGRLRRESRQSLAERAPVQPDPNWSPLGEAAWKDVETFAEQVNVEHISPDKPEEWWALLKQVLDLVAHKYHPQSREPVLETPVPHVLRVLELVARDLREAFSENIPGAHILTIHDALKMQRVAKWFPTMNKIYRVASLALNPATALVKEASRYLQGKVIDAGTQETKRWALQFAVKRAGYYAIELYSGRLSLPDEAFEKPTASTQQLVDQAQQQQENLRGEPLKILVIGQAKAGKSSLINALFGEVRASVDVLPHTPGVTAYVLTREIFPSTVILDTAGYGDIQQPGALQAAQQEFLQCDLILLTVSSTTAARDLDSQLVHKLRATFAQHPDRRFPPMLVVLTHIDLLRPFREWSPPYSLEPAESPKAQSIRAAIEAVADDLSVDASSVIPVCLREEAIYNVTEVLEPAISHILPQARKECYLRALREYRDEHYWDQLWKQSTNSGRLLWKAGGVVMGEAAKKVDELGRRILGHKP